MRISVPKWFYDLTGMGCGFVLLLISLTYAITGEGFGQIVAIIFTLLLIFYFYDTITSITTKKDIAKNREIKEELIVNANKLSDFIAIEKPIEAKNYLKSHSELLNGKMVFTLRWLSWQARQMGNTSSEHIYIQRSKLLEQCVNIGIDQAFKDLI